MDSPYTGGQLHASNLGYLLRHLDTPGAKLPVTSYAIPEPPQPGGGEALSLTALAQKQESGF